MIATVLLAMQLAAPPSVRAMPPQDWSTLPLLDYHKPVAPPADASQFVRGEVVAGRCTRAVRGPTGWTLSVDLAVLGTADGVIRRIVPRAIDCPTVEQYAAGLALSMARGNLDQRAGAADTWYRTSVVFTWAP